MSEVKQNAELRKKSRKRKALLQREQVALDGDFSEIPREGAFDGGFRPARPRYFAVKLFCHASHQSLPVTLPCSTDDVNNSNVFGLCHDAVPYGSSIFYI